jgi:hypothetical protein
MCVCKKSKTHCPRTELADIENGSVCRNILDCSVVCIRMRSSFSRTSTAGKAPMFKWKQRFLPAFKKTTQFCLSAFMTVQLNRSKMFLFLLKWPWVSHGIPFLSSTLEKSISSQHRPSRGSLAISSSQSVALRKFLIFLHSPSASQTKPYYCRED